MRTLKQLFEAIPVTVRFPVDLPDVTVSGIAFDSRDVQRGEVFVALEGGSFDGHKYIPMAVSKGAAAVVGSKELTGVPVPYIRVDEARFALAHLSAAFFGFPARKLTVIGVTGTDGKTTTANLIYNILKSAGIKAGMISTVNAVIGEGEVEDTGFHVTTPEAPIVQGYLSRMVDAGVTHVVLEATSHGLAQHRATACEFDIGVVTNITHEHLDYHGSYEEYFQAKARLFRELARTAEKPHGNPRLAVLNLDDRSYCGLSAQPGMDQVSYSIESNEADLRADDVQSTPDGLRFNVMIQPDGMQFSVDCQLAGVFNVSNCLAAIGAAVIGLGISPEAARQGIQSMQGLVGRMERIDLGQDFTAIVDFAHTPNALERALSSARNMTHGRVIAVYGSAGLRDRMKRRMMAEGSIKLADLTVLTAEDPRTEDLEDILAEMADAAQLAGGVEGRTFWRVPDRGDALRFAVGLARPGDLVISCGKGHEQSMCFGEIEYAWDDGVALRAALAAHLGVEGPEMPYLPTQGEKRKE